MQYKATYVSVCNNGLVAVNCCNTVPRLTVCWESLTNSLLKHFDEINFDELLHETLKHLSNKVTYSIQFSYSKLNKII